jgi:hypothetical protein
VERGSGHNQGKGIIFIDGFRRSSGSGALTGAGVVETKRLQLWENFSAINGDHWQLGACWPIMVSSAFLRLPDSSFASDIPQCRWPETCFALVDGFHLWRTA